MNDQDAIVLRDESSMSISDDSGFLLSLAKHAEERIDAVVKIKQMALKVTNASDWTDQGGKPYCQVSGAEKIANLFGISWKIGEPQCEFEPGGHFTYTYRGEFTANGRTIEVDGSRSSKDPFFKKYEYVNGQRVEKPVTDIDKRDVKMAAMTNLLGNGITRLLGIRNMTYADLEAFAGIKQSDVAKVEYKGNKQSSKPTVAPPQAKAADEATSDPSKISAAQGRLLKAKASNNEGGVEVWMPKVKAFCGVEHTADIPKAMMNECLAILDGKEPTEAQA
jgi:hypothetical protein